MLQVTVLGCGGSLGVPRIGCDCPVCNSTSTYNKRTRSAIIIDNNDTRILVDFGFDIKSQLTREGIKRLDAAVLTHDHADHVSGIDDLRVFSFLQNEGLKIYTDHKTAEIVVSRYGYLFDSSQLVIQPVDQFAKFSIKNLEIQLFKQKHGPIDSLGVRVGDFVYSSDVADFPTESKSYLHNINTWFLDCKGYKSNDRHAGLDRVIKWDKEFAPKKIFLTNLTHTFDYHEMSKELPVHYELLYDGLKLCQPSL